MKVIAFFCVLTMLLAGCDINKGLDDLVSLTNNENINGDDNSSGQNHHVKISTPVPYRVMTLIDPFDQDNLTQKKQQVTALPEQKKLMFSAKGQVSLLQFYPLSQLKLVGVVEQKNNKWGVVETPDGKVHQVIQGQYIGSNEGRVKKITYSGLQIIESIRDQKNIRKQKGVYLWLNQER